ncbi:Major Facilitator Superfamily protein [Nonomuraea solani]|uniref:Major Facilitator Superfamily protein n=1 Tax=Nonomuraea solani TaxID=1144553 RepID=A0A1H6EQX4_9ACTN|nr:MFS transporter [Nonomuraea solani]SEH00257.1 Major Facilitator Superfamily protein [Nonomuraea solani]
MPRTHPHTTEAEQPSPARAGTVVAVLTFAGIVTAFVQTLVFPIVPRLPQLLDASASDTAWVVTATLLCGVVSTPVMGRLGDLYGKRRMLLLGVALLVAGSMICALSDSLAPLLAGRALQGLGNCVIPLSMSILRDTLPADRLPAATAVTFGSTGVGGALGLPAAAIIADTFDWHVLFWTSAILGAAAAVLILRLVPESGMRTGGRFDLTGAAGLAVGLVCLLLVVSKGSDWGWDSAATLAFFAAAVVVLPLWAWFELRSAEPMVDLRTTVRPQVLFTHLAALSLGVALFATNLVLPQLLQLPEATGYGLGKSLVITGLVMAPQGLVMMAASPFSARLTKTKGPKVTLMVGSVIVAAGYLLSMVMMAEVWQIAVASCVVAIGVGFAFGALPTLIMGAVPVSGTAAANGLNTLMRAIGTSVSSAVAGVILAEMTIDFNGVHLPSENGLRAVLAIAASAAVVAFASASFIPRQRQAATRADPPALAETTGKSTAAE